MPIRAVAQIRSLIATHDKQATPYPSAVNTITVTVAVSFAMTDARIDLTSFTSANMQSVPRLPIACRSNMSTWTRTL